MVVAPSQAAREAGWKLNFTLNSDFPIAADMNPGMTGGTPQDDITHPQNSARSVIVNSNSNNHNGDGQNVLFADGHVDWTNNPYCGPQRPTVNTPKDHLWTAGARADAAAPAPITSKPAGRAGRDLAPDRRHRRAVLTGPGRLPALARGKPADTYAPA